MDHRGTNTHLELPIKGGSVKVLQDLEADGEHHCKFGVVVEHPSVRNGERPVWKGNDAGLAEQVALAVVEALNQMGFRD